MSILIGSQNIITYATVHGLLIGWDLRSQKVAWKLKNDPKHGTVPPLCRCIINYIYSK